LEDSFDLVQDYYVKKAKLLGVEQLHDYDRYAPIGKIEREFSFEKSKEIVLEAFKEFSIKFYEIALLAFEKNLIDAFPNKNKQSGAFSMSTSIYPYVLLNHTNRIRDLFTLAHELGHFIHQYLSKDLGEILSDTPLTISETASIFAEMLIFDFIKDEFNKDEKISLYASKLEDIFATLFRQAIFTNFERRVYEKKEELSIEEISKIWIEENKKMFGNSLKLTKNYSLWWSYIPHFIHSPFYCYSYSYGLLLVMSLYRLYKQEDKDFVDKYIKFLSYGGSKNPKEMVKLFGFNIESKNFWRMGIKEIERIFLEFKELIK